MSFWFLLAALMGPRFFARFVLFFVLGMGLNRAVSLPSQYLAQTGSGLDHLKMEVLSRGATYRNFTNTRAAIAFPVNTPGSWPVSSTAYLVPWANGACPWTSELLQSLNHSTLLVCFRVTVSAVQLAVAAPEASRTRDFSIRPVGPTAG